jgi:putative membrane protein
MITVIRHKKDEVRFSDIGHLFTSKNFTPVFKTVLLKQLLIFLWNLPIFCGSLLSVFNAYKILNISEKLPAHTVLTAQSEAGQQILQYTPSMLLGSLLILVGLGITIPQYYAYSQAELILYDQLETDTYLGAFSAIRQSRKLMKGYKGKLFLLDLSFIGWNLLAKMTYGILNIMVLPYTATAYILFYEELKKEKAILNENNPQARNSLS